jgi:hypothetical protein
MEITSAKALALRNGLAAVLQTNREEIRMNPQPKYRTRLAEPRRAGEIVQPI